MSKTFERFNDGSIQFRLRITTSILSHKAILIRNIRNSSLESPGISTAEASFLQLIDKITNGSEIEINTTGTQLSFVPGILIGGKHEHVCEERGIGWFLEGIIPLLPFGKESIEMEFSGITEGMCEIDPSVDYFRYTLPPILNHFDIFNSEKGSSFNMNIISRGGANGGGVVTVSCPTTNQLSAIDLVDMGKIKRIRGYAISCRMNPSYSARVSHSSKGLCLRLIPDVWIHSDVNNASSKKNPTGCGPNPALGLCIHSESTTGVIFCSESCFSSNRKELPEDVGIRAAALLFEEISKGGCVDSTLQTLVLLWMCLTSEDVSRVRLGKLSPYTINALRLFKKFFQVEFKVSACEEEGKKSVLLSCLGSGYRNMARAST